MWIEIMVNVRWKNMYLEKKEAILYTLFPGKLHY